MAYSGIFRKNIAITQYKNFRDICRASEKEGKKDKATQISVYSNNVKTQLRGKNQRETEKVSIRVSRLCDRPEKLFSFMLKIYSHPKEWLTLLSLAIIFIGCLFFILNLLWLYYLRPVYYSPNTVIYFPFHLM